MTMIIDGTNGLTFPDNSRQYNGYFGFKNRIINGAMVIDQRNAGASVTLGAGTAYVLDRFDFTTSQASKISAQRNAGSVTPPIGFGNYLGITSLSAYSILASDYFLLSQKIEGFNTSDLGWGTANAQSITLSFWVRSSLTGTFGGSFTNSAANRFYPFSYTINAANTWEQKTITVAGDTTGTWVGATNGIGISVFFGLGVGSTNSGTAGAWGTTGYSATGATSVVGTNGATFYITGVQLEKGSTATSFDYRPYGTELALCQRYYCKTFPIGTAPAQAAALSGCLTVGNCPASQSISLAATNFVYPVSMRTNPATVTTYAPLIANSGFRNSGGNNVPATVDFIGDRQLTIYNTNALAAAAVRLDIHVSADAEL